MRVRQMGSTGFQDLVSRSHSQRVHNHTFDQSKPDSGEVDWAVTRKSKDAHVHAKSTFRLDWLVIMVNEERELGGHFTNLYIADEAISSAQGQH